MEFIIKKTKSDPSGTISLGTLVDKIGITDLSMKLDELSERVDDLKFEEYKKGILKIIRDVIINLGSAVNITNVASIEKNKKILPGTIYFNTEKNELRFKNSNNKWIALI